MSAMKIRAKAIKDLEKKYGRIETDDLIKEAKNPKHALHGDFQWDIKKAAYEHWQDTARAIIASVRIVFDVGSKKITAVGYVRDPNTDRGYVSVTKLRSESEVAYEALLAETERIQSMLERAEELANVLGLQKELRAIMDDVMNLKSRMRKGPGQPEDRVSA